MIPAETENAQRVAVAAAEMFGENIAERDMMIAVTRITTARSPDSAGGEFFFGSHGRLTRLEGQGAARQH